MKKSHLQTWFSEFPKLRSLLSKEDKDILDAIDPADYRYFNITRESEVVRIINEHKPQAWKWIQLYPRLKDLPMKDMVILDHIVPTDYMEEITEEDVRRIIRYRKSEMKKAKDNTEDLKARQYYEDHKDEIAREERSRSILTKVVKYSSLFGIAVTTAGVVLHSSAHLLVGSSLIVLPVIVSAMILKRIDAASVVQKPIKAIKSNLDPISIAFIIFYLIGLIGMGITIGTLPVWEVAGWDLARSVLFIGLSTIGISLMLFLIVAIATPSKK